MSVFATIARMAGVAALVFFGAGSATGCAARDLGRADRIDSSAPLPAARIARLRELMAERASQEGVATHRVLLSIGRRQFDLNSRLAMSPTHGLRLVALVSMGQVMLDVWVKPDGEVVMMREPMGLRPAWVERFVARDIQTLYRSMGEGDYRFARLETGEAVAVRAAGKNLVLRHRFDEEGERWLGSEIVRGRRLVWVAENRTPPESKSRDSESPDSDILPTVFVTTPRYRLVIQTTGFKTGPPNPKLFEAHDSEDSP